MPLGLVARSHSTKMGCPSAAGETSRPAASDPGLGQVRVHLLSYPTVRGGPPHAAKGMINEVVVD